jgi:hypothetical protein
MPVDLLREYEEACMSERARILTFGFTSDEQARIDESLVALGVPSTTQLKAEQGQVVLKDIIDRGTVGQQRFNCRERLVLFHNISDAGLRSLIQMFKAFEVPRPIFAVVTETSINWTLEQLMEHLVEEKRAHEGST